MPYIESGNISSYAQYTIASDNRDKIIASLQNNKIPYTIHYPKALHQQLAFSSIVNKQSLINSETAANRVLSLPFHPYMTEEDVEKVAKAVRV